MPDVTMDAQAIHSSAAVIGRLLLLHAPLPSNVDGGASARAGLKLRRIKRALTPVVERIEAELEEERIQAGRGRSPAEDFTVAAKAILRTEHTFAVPELLTREDWDAIPMQAPHTMPNAGTDGQPVIVTLRKTEADFDTLGPLVSEPDEVP
jgi:hypothetical protein